MSRCIGGKDATDYSRFGLINLSLSRCYTPIGPQFAHDAVAVGFPTRDLASDHPSDLAAPGFLRKILQEESIHGPLQTDVQFIDLTFRCRMDSDAHMGEALEDGGDVLLITAQSVQTLGEDDFKLSVAGALHQ
nr:hypothetical protein [Ruegeria atlantica]